MGRIIAVGSGCGGVGKSTIAVSAARYAARHGKQTILLDASGISRSCDLMLSLESIVVIDMMDVVKQQTAITNALYDVPDQKNLRFACASLYEGVSLSELSGVLLALRVMCDVLIIDLPTGHADIGDGVLDDNDALLLVTRPEDVSIRALERMMNTLPRDGAQKHLVINRSNGGLIKKKAQYAAANAEIMLDLPASGVISEEESVQVGASAGKAALDCGLRLKGEFEKLFRNVF